MTETTEFTTVVSEGTRLDVDWGVNKDGWEFEVTNNTKYNLDVYYWDTSNVALAQTPIPAGETCRVKGKKGLIDWPADMDFQFSLSSDARRPGWSRIFIVGNLVNGDVTRTVQNDPDKIIDAYVPARRSNETQVVVFQQRDFWGPNWNGWEFTVKNDTGRDLSFRGGSNLSERDGVIPKGGTGKVKGAHSIAPGGPANCDFSYFAEKHADIWDSGAITIRSEEDGNVTCLPHSEGKIGVKVSSQPRDGIQEVTFFAR